MKFYFVFKLVNKRYSKYIYKIMKNVYVCACCAEEHLINKVHKYKFLLIYLYLY